VTPDSTVWDPIVYTETACGDNSTQYTCNDFCSFATTNYGGVGCSGSAGTTGLTTGPYPVNDVADYQLDFNGNIIPPIHDFDVNVIHDGYTQERDRDISIIVDSQNSGDNGGIFDLSILEESHNNNDCYNTASYVAAPIIDGAFDWKQRWRGEMTEDYYNSFFGADPTLTLGYTGNGATPDPDNPRQAFFKFEIPAGSGRYLAYVDYYGLEQKSEAGYTDPILDPETNTAGHHFFDATLTRLHPVADTCDLGGLENSALPSPNPPHIIIDASSTDEEGWLAVANKDYFDPAVPAGQYELSIVKEQPVFFGLATNYQGEGGCAAAGTFNGEGQRVDWIPNGSTENGYMVVNTYIGDGPDTCPGISGGVADWGWLVHPACYPGFSTWGGVTVNSIDWIDLPFRFPIGDQFANMLYLDTAGRLLPREGVGSCTLDADCTLPPPYDVNDYCACSARVSGGDCVGDTGKCVRGNPNGTDSDVDMRKFFASPSAGGYAPVIAAAWGRLQPEWRNGSLGYVIGETRVFEGTTVYVVSWIGYDVGNKLSDGGWFSEDYQFWESHLNFQIILRPDGRFIYYYRENVAGFPDGWDEAITNNTWSVGVSGGLPDQDCGEGDPGNNQCQAWYGGEASCDNQEIHSGTFDYSGTRRCQRTFPGLLNGDGLGNE
jgi:hypothetical protein